MARNTKFIPLIFLEYSFWCTNITDLILLQLWEEVAQKLTKCSLGPDDHDWTCPVTCHCLCDLDQVTNPSIWLGCQRDDLGFRYLTGDKVATIAYMIEASTNMMDLGYHLHPTISGFSAFFFCFSAFLCAHLQHFYKSADLYQSLTQSNIITYTTNSKSRSKAVALVLNGIQPEFLLFTFAVSHPLSTVQW